MITFQRPGRTADDRAPNKLYLNRDGAGDAPRPARAECAAA
jgi:hypothetical protein